MENKQHKDRNPAEIPFVVFEAAADRAERRIQRQAKMITYLAALLIGSNICWILLWSLLK